MQYIQNPAAQNENGNNVTQLQLGSRGFNQIC